MESQNHKIVKGFLTEEEKIAVMYWVGTINVVQNIENHHIQEIRKNLNGSSYMYNVSKTPLTNEITQYQSSNNVIKENVPPVIKGLIDKISEAIDISKDNVFLQVLVMDSGGKINPHYDMAIDGYVNYKCNISVLSDEYRLVVDKDVINVSQGDLYCFEASLYKHWTEKSFDSKRVLLSFGFILPYSELGRDENDYRVRLSRRIEKYIQ